ncbi:MAG TPA: right-handed parallel beta-helix repeat-containing protein, partial [Longimicrobium sp.]
MLPLHARAPLSRRSPHAHLCRALLLSVLAACGGAGGPASPDPSGAEPEVARIVATPAGGGVAVTPSGATLAAGATVQLTAVDDAGRAVAGVRWSSGDPAVATVAATGLVTAVAPGSAVVEAASKSRTATAQVTVSAPAPPPGGTPISPGDDIQARVDAAAPGTHFVLRAGVHRLQHVRPRDGMVFAGEPGAVLSGARLLEGWARSGAAWVIGGQTQQGAAAGVCEDGGQACRWPEDLFLDDVPLRRVASAGEVAPGTWYFDYAADRVLVGSDPIGRRVEISVLPHAFSGGAAGVVVRGVVIEKYATPAQQGTLQGNATSGWTVEDSEIRLNHGIGLRTGNGMRVLRSRIHHNGQMGIGGSGNGVLVEGNEIHHNNTLGFDPAWEAGGSKFVRTDGLVLRGNFSHHNHGHGLWTDIDNVNTLYEANRVEDNTRSGIFHEISYRAVIRGNVARRNGGGGAQWVDGAGILVNSSRDVEIYGNVVEGNLNGIAAVQSARGSGAHGAYELANLYVHHNDVAMAQGRSGVVQNAGSQAVFASMNVR